MWLIEVGEIQASTNPEQWRCVPTKLNAFDLLTRGLSVSTLPEAESYIVAREQNRNQGSVGC